MIVSTRCGFIDFGAWRSFHMQFEDWDMPVPLIKMWNWQFSKHCCCTTLNMSFCIVIVRQIILFHWNSTNSILLKPNYGIFWWLVTGLSVFLFYVFLQNNINSVKIRNILNCYEIILFQVQNFRIPYCYGIFYIMA